MKFLKVYEEIGSTARRPGSDRPSKITQHVKDLVEAEMQSDDETTATQLHTMLNKNRHFFNDDFEVCIKFLFYSTLHCIFMCKTNWTCTCTCRCRTSLGWTFRGSAYCQLIHEVNKMKRLEWARKYQGDNFDDVVWTDECTVQLENHRTFCCRKVGCAPRPKPK